VHFVAAEKAGCSSVLPESSREEAGMRIQNLVVRSFLKASALTSASVSEITKRKKAKDHGRGTM